MISSLCAGVSFVKGHVGIPPPPPEVGAEQTW